MRILIIDDKRHHCAAAQIQFEGLGHEVEILHAKFEAGSRQAYMENIFNRIKNGSFDAVLTDMIVPIGDRMLDGGEHYPLGIAIAWAATAHNVPIVGILSNRQGHGPTFAMEILAPAFSNAYGLNSDLFGSSFLQFNSEFIGWAATGSPYVYSDEEIEQMRNIAGWSSQRYTDLDNARMSAQPYDPAKGDACEEYEKKDPRKSFQPVKNWRGFLMDLIKRDPGQRYLKELPSLEHKGEFNAEGRFISPAVTP